jgi:hypothetical protein
MLARFGKRWRVGPGKGTRFLDVKSILIWTSTRVWQIDKLRDVERKGS